MNYKQNMAQTHTYAMQKLLPYNLIVKKNRKITNCLIINTFTASVRSIHTLKSWMSCYFHATLQLHNSPGDCSGELFKSSKDAASLLVCIKKLEKLWISIFCG